MHAYISDYHCTHDHWCPWLPGISTSLCPWVIFTHGLHTLMYINNANDDTYIPQAFTDNAAMNVTKSQNEWTFDFSPPSETTSITLNLTASGRDEQKNFPNTAKLYLRKYRFNVKFGRNCVTSFVLYTCVRLHLKHHMYMYADFPCKGKSTMAVPVKMFTHLCSFLNVTSILVANGLQFVCSTGLNANRIGSFV